MCVILSIHQKEFNKDSQKKIMANIKTFQYQNDDGVGILAFNPNKRRYFLHRSLKNENGLIAKTLSRYKNVNLHFRHATSGKVNEDNVHFWKNKNWLFAHNGAIGNFAFGKDSPLSDSNLLFRQLVFSKSLKDNHKIKYKRIDKFVKNLDFWGRFIIPNIHTQRIYFFGDFNTHLINDNTLVFASQELSFDDEEKTKRFAGLTFDKKTASDRTLWKGEREGIFYFDLKSGKTHNISNEFNEISYGHSSHSSTLKIFDKHGKMIEIEKEETFENNISEEPNDIVERRVC